MRWGLASGCGILGGMYARGIGVAKDEEQAFQLAERACSAGHASSCTNSGLMHEDGRGVKKDKAKAADAYQRACDAGDAYGCSRLATLYNEGKGLAKDPTRALELHERACEQEIASSCYAAGLATEDPDRAAKLLSRGCYTLRSDRPFEPEAAAFCCISLSSMYQKGEGVPKDDTKAAEAINLACSKGRITGDVCFRLRVPGK